MLVEDLYARLVAAGTLAGDSIYWMKVPQNEAFPYVRMQAVGGDKDQHLKGYTSARVTRIQVDCFAKDYLTSRQLADEIAAAMNPPATVGNTRFGHTASSEPRDLGEDIADGFVHRTSIDLLVEHAAA